MGEFDPDRLPPLLLAPLVPPAVVMVELKVAVPAETIVALLGIHPENGDGRNVEDMTPGSNGVGMKMADAM